MARRARHRAGRSPLAIDLFAGCGGLTLGLRQAGFNVVAAVDNQPIAVATYERNHPDARVWCDDIRRVDAFEIREALRLKVGELDLVAGCPPCQGFSTLRTLQGAHRVNDARNDLVFEVLRFVREFEPRAVMLENVPGLAKDPRLSRFCRSIRAMGYHCDFEVLDASDYAVPQRRKRMVLLASRNGHIDFAPPVKERVTVRDAIAWLPHPRSSKDPLHCMRRRHSVDVRAIIRRIPRNGGSRVSLGTRSQLGCHKRCDGFYDTYGRMSWDDVAPTITGGCVNPSKGRFLHPSQNRSISLREAALLQTFPPQYFFSLDRGIGAVAAMIGNALPPAFVRHHARAIRRHLDLAAAP